MNDNVYVYGFNTNPDNTIPNIKGNTRGPSWGPPNTRSASCRDVNPQGVHGDVWFLTFSTFLVMGQGEVRP